MPDLLIGPLLRYVSETEATIWVETSERARSRSSGAREPTFAFEDHHYALVGSKASTPAPPTSTRSLDGRRSGRSWRACPRQIGITSAGRWRSPSAPAASPCRTSRRRLGQEAHPTRTASTRCGSPARGRGENERFRRQLFLLGDQVYVDEGSPASQEIRETARPIGARRSLDFEEYTWLYRESWREPAIRWLFSTVSVSMLWDDHDMSDDWNISHSWLERCAAVLVAPPRRTDSYWIYQHLGNLSPDELGREVYRESANQQASGSSGPTDRLSTHPARAGASIATSAEPGCVHRLARRSCARADRRAIVDEEEWDWIVEHCSGDFDHLLLATTVPFFLSPAFDRLEAWNEPLRRRLGRRDRQGSELLRREVDFDHWAAFQDSFAR